MAVDVRIIHENSFAYPLVVETTVLLSEKKHDTKHDKHSNDQSQYRLSMGGGVAVLTDPDNAWKEKKGGDLGLEKIWYSKNVRASTADIK